MGCRASAAGIVLLSAMPGTGGAGAYENGAPPGHTGGFGEESCLTCHSDNAVNERRGRLTISGLPDRYRPGKRYELVLLLEHSALESGGFQLSLRTPDGRPAGRLHPDTSRVGEVVSEDGVRYLQHTSTGRRTGDAGTIRWSFTWQAPEHRRLVTLHAAANAANDDLSALGDFIYTLVKRIDGPDDPEERGPERSRNR